MIGASCYIFGVFVLPDCRQLKGKQRAQEL